MKKYILLTVLLFGLTTQKSMSQATHTPNTYNALYYLGWDVTGAGEPVPFNVAGANLMNLTGIGDLNVTGALTGGANGYMINGYYMLWNAGDITSIYVGGFAGDGITPSSANTFWGYGTGNSTFTGSYNSFGGYLSGVSNVYGDSNVFIGNQCGYNNSSGSVNVYIGNLAGYNSNADSNVFIGDQSGYWNSTGYENIFSPDKI